jgi:hypothetical protein
MWVVNNMFGTGGKGFAIITAVIPITTYALVFNLLHPTTKKAILEGIKTAATSPQRLWQKLRNSFWMAVFWVRFRFQYLWWKLKNGGQETRQV